MARETVKCLSQWALELGVDRHTLKRWLAADGILLPHVRPRAKTFIRENDIERVLRKRTARTDWTLLRGKRRSGF